MQIYIFILRLKSKLLLTPMAKPKPEPTTKGPQIIPAAPPAYVSHAIIDRLALVVLSTLFIHYFPFQAFCSLQEDVSKVFSRLRRQNKISLRVKFFKTLISLILRSEINEISVLKKIFFGCECRQMSFETASSPFYGREATSFPRPSLWS